MSLDTSSKNLNHSAPNDHYAGPNFPRAADSELDWAHFFLKCSWLDGYRSATSWSSASKFLLLAGPRAQFVWPLPRFYSRGPWFSGHTACTIDLLAVQELSLFVGCLAGWFGLVCWGRHGQQGRRQEVISHILRALCLVLVGLAWLRIENGEAPKYRVGFVTTMTKITR